MKTMRQEAYELIAEFHEAINELNVEIEKTRKEIELLKERNSKTAEQRIKEWKAQNTWALVD